MPQRTDEELMEHYAARGDGAAVAVLAERWRPAALAVARRIAGGIAEDAVQEAFLHLLRRGRSYAAGRPFAPWFLVLLRHCCIDLLRRQARQETPAAQVPEAAVEDAPAVAPEVAPHLARLSAEDRRVLLMRVVDELPFREIGRHLGCTEEAAKKRAARALVRLRHLMAAGGG